MTPETLIKKEIKDYLSKTGWEHWPIIQDFRRARGKKGLSDRQAIRNGVVLFIEVKTDHSDLTDDQKEFRDMIEREKGHYIVARSYKDIEKYLRWLHWENQ